MKDDNLINLKAPYKSGPKLLLIDGTNLCFREFFAQKQLSFRGINTNVIFGLFRSFIYFNKMWPDHLRIIAWEGGYTRRLEESKRGVELGLCPETYKENRRRRISDNCSSSIDLDPLFAQMDVLRSEGIDLTKTLQVCVKGYEADDVLNTYADYSNRHNGDAIIVSSDQDFYQCISDNVRVFDARLNKMLTKEKFIEDYGYKPHLWLDKGAIEGEVGESKDNIFGVDGWGPKIASKYVKEFGNCDSIRSGILAKPEGKRGKREQVFLSQFDRLMLAKSLKRMDVISNIPMPRVSSKNDDELRKFLIDYGCMSLTKDIWRLT